MVEELERLKRLFDEGGLSEEEYLAAKADKGELWQYPGSIRFL